MSFGDGMAKKWYLDRLCVDCCILVVAHTLDIIYFKNLYFPLPKVQGLKMLKIAFHNNKTKEIFQRNILTYFCVSSNASNL